MVTRLYLDTEFIDTGRRLLPVAIGVARDDGARYYAEVWGAPLEVASEWVRDNVLPYLVMTNNRLGVPRDIVKRSREIADDLIGFAGPDPEWWADHGAYDWVILSQLYGPLTARPAGWPYRHRDPIELLDLAGIPDELAAPPENTMPGFEHLPDTAHHAMAGALRCQALTRRAMTALAHLPVRGLT